jgi:hypothetical protein
LFHHHPRIEVDRRIRDVKKLTGSKDPTTEEGEHPDEE